MKVEVGMRNSELIKRGKSTFITLSHPLPVGATSRSRSYRKQELAPTEDSKMELPDVKRKNAFVLIK